MRHAILAALVLCACAGYTHGTEGLYDGGSAIGGPGGSDAGDAGADGGRDGGDGGCTAISLNTTTIFEGCVSNNGGVGSVSVDATHCTATVNIFTVTCTGAVTGAHDAFDGGCSGVSNSCTSTSLPGTIVCATGPSSSCTIVVDGGP